VKRCDINTSEAEPNSVRTSPGGGLNSVKMLQSLLCLDLWQLILNWLNVNLSNLELD